MNWYAIMDGLRVRRVVSQAGAPTLPHHVLVNYTGIPPMTGNELRAAGGVLYWVDTRTLAQAKQQKGEQLRAAASADILGFMDEIGEILGALANGETPTASHRNKVAAFRTKVQARRAAVVSATTIAEVDAINW